MDIFDIMPLKHRVLRLYPGGVIITAWRDGCGVPFQNVYYLTPKGEQNLEYAPIGTPVMSWYEFDDEWKQYADEIRSHRGE